MDSEGIPLQEYSPRSDAPATGMSIPLQQPSGKSLARRRPQRWRNKRLLRWVAALTDLTLRDFAFLATSLSAFAAVFSAVALYQDSADRSALLTQPIRFVYRHSCYYLAYMLVPFMCCLLYWYSLGRMPHLTQRALETNVNDAELTLKASLEQAGSCVNAAEVVQALILASLFFFLDLILVEIGHGTYATATDVILVCVKAVGALVVGCVFLPRTRSGLMCHELAACKQDVQQQYLGHELMERVRHRAWIAGRRATVSLALTLACGMSALITVATTHPVDLVLMQPTSAVAMAGACNISQSFVETQCLPYARYQIGLLPEAFHFCSCECIPHDGWQILTNNCSSYAEPNFLGVYAGVGAACQAVGSFVPTLGPLNSAIWLSLNVVFGLLLSDVLVLSESRTKAWVKSVRAFSIVLFALNFTVCCPIYLTVLLAPTDKCFTGRDAGLISSLFIDSKNWNSSAPITEVNTYAVVLAILLLVASSQLTRGQGLLIVLRGANGKARPLAELCERSLRAITPGPPSTAYSKFVTVPAAITVGRPEDAALGLNNYMRVGDDEVARRRLDGIDAVQREFDEHGTESDRECLRYCRYERAGSSPKLFPNSPYPRDCDASGVLPERCISDDQGTRGMTLAEFMQHPSSRRARLTEAQVLALRVYTTAAFELLNSPLRDLTRREPHGFPVTLTLIKEAIGKLRAVEAPTVSGERAFDLFRGMRNVVTTDEFILQGGTELSPMSTTSELSVALQYCGEENGLLFVLHTDSFMARGADIAYLSCFPNEAEYLFPPLTYLRPTGKAEVLNLDEIMTLRTRGGVVIRRSDVQGLGKIKVVEVVPHFNA